MGMGMEMGMEMAAQPTVCRIVHKIGSSTNWNKICDQQMQ